MNVLVTGAGGGLGRAFAVECAARGYNICLTDINGEGLAKIQNGLLRQFGANALMKACDITDDAEVMALGNFLSENGFEPDMLINVAGVDFEGGFCQRDFGQISGIIRLNIEGTLRVTHRVLDQKSGGKMYIINVCSLAAKQPMPLKATYAASKRFLLDFSLALSEELRSRGVSVLALCPGGLATTKETIEAIGAQGFYGAVTTNALERMTAKTLDYAMRGKKVYIPGLVNKILAFFGKFVPPSVTAHILFRRWEKAQKRWLYREG